MAYPLGFHAVRSPSIKPLVAHQYAVLYEALAGLGSVSRRYDMPARKGGSTLDEVISYISARPELSNVPLLEAHDKLVNAAIMGHVFKLYPLDFVPGGKRNCVKYSLLPEGVLWLAQNRHLRNL